jgi:hypothetical protein
MSVNFTPELQPYKQTGSFKFWCQKVLPLVYDDSLSYYELLCKVVNYLNNVIQNADGLYEDVQALQNAYNELQNYVNNYFDNLDVQNEIDNKLDEMAESGVLSGILRNQSLRGKNIILIGDSYVRGTGGTIGRGIGYYFPLISQANVTVYANGGAGFTRPGNPGSGDFNNMTYYQFLQTFETTMTVNERQGIEILLTTGGINDNSAGVDEIVTAVNNYCNLAKELFPNANIVIVPTFCDTGFTAMRYFNVYRLIVNTAASCGAKSTINSIYWFFGRTSYAAGDNIHLNESGYQLCSGYIAAFLLGWNGEYSPIAGADSSFAEGVTGNVRLIRQNSLVTFSGNIHFTTATSENLYSVGSEFRPNTGLYFPCFLFTSTLDTRGTTIMRVYPNGTINLANLPNPPAEGDIYFNTTWFIGL